MGYPIQPRDIDPERQALAPYNFVPLGSKVVTVTPDDLPDQGVYDPKRRTGRIECRLTTETPLYVRGPLTPEEFEQAESDAEAERSWREQTRNKPEFFYVDVKSQAPVIPGSSLRGMFRTLVEIVAYGKVKPVSQQKLFFRAVADRMTTLRESYQRQMQQAQAGYVTESDGDYSIRPARQIGGYSFFKVSEAVLREGRVTFIPLSSPHYRPQYVKCWFNTSDRYADSASAVSATQKPDYIQGFLVCSGRFGRKKQKHWLIPHPDSNVDPLPIPEEAVEAYIDTLTRHQRQKPPFNPKTGCLVPGNPVFYYEQHGEVVGFGPTRNFRVAYRKPGERAALSPRDFVPPALRTPEDVDLAEAIFGYVEPEREKGRGKRKGVALAGRVFVSDARLADNQSLEEIWLTKDQNEVTVPRILAGPKPTTFAHYLVQRRPNRIRVKGRRDHRNVLDLSHYSSQTPDDTVIRGHKLYWHKGPVEAADIEEEQAVQDNDTQHTQIRPVRSGTQFRFTLRFENLSDVELGALLWILDKAAKPKYRLKLGMGKPLGMGAIKIDEPKLLLDSRAARYQTLFDGDKWALPPAENKKIWDEAIKSFEQFMVSRIKPKARFGKLKRIYALLTMLSWPGPDPAATRYLEIERPDRTARNGKRNEYADRPVLPDPYSVAKKHPRPKGKSDRD